jgi:hypothetical protein
MKPALMLTAAVLALGGLAGAAEVQVKVRDGRMAIEAVNVPLREVIDRVANRTGMRVIYDGDPPQQLVKVSLSERSAADAVVGILEGRGVNFAVILNAAGTQVQTLLVSTVKPPPAAVLPPEEPAGEVNGPEVPPPPPQPGTMAEEPRAAPPPTAPPAQQTPTPVPATLPTPIPPSVSPFTPQGPGPIILPIPGATTPPSY